MILDCECCDATVGAEPVEHYTAFDSNEAQFEFRYTLLKCPKCSGAFLVIEDRLCDDPHSEFSDPVLLYPAKRKADRNLPKRVREPFQEALTCLRAKTYTATAMMCRKTLEAICIQHDVRSGTLKTKLRSLQTADVIDKRLFEWSDALRISGNEAAHNVDVSVDRQEAQDIVDFTHALLEYIFTFREKFDTFMQRRNPPTTTLNGS